MSTIQRIVVEILSGPLDGMVVELAEDTDWGREAKDAFSFPWDEGLGNPQARFMHDGDAWQLQCIASEHGTYRARTGERFTEGTLALAEGDVVKASNTWLLIRET